jgi:hypothetical protein
LLGNTVNGSGDTSEVTIDTTIADAPVGMHTVALKCNYYHLRAGQGVYRVYTVDVAGNVSTASTAKCPLSC